MIRTAKRLICLLLMTTAASSVALGQTTGLLTGQTTAPASERVEPDIVWLDVRSWAEYQLDHIDGDRRISHTEVVGKVAELFPDKSTPIRLYCASGGRAGRAAEGLRAAGYTDIQNAGGIDQVRVARFGEAGAAPAVAD